MDWVRKTFQCVSDLLRSAYKYVYHWYTGQCEIARICGGLGPRNLPQHTFHMTLSLAKSLKRSKQLVTYSKIIFFPKPFSISAVQSFILQRKHLEDAKVTRPILVANLSHCLRSLRLMNVVYEHLQVFRRKEFSYSDAHHVDLLERLWQALQPGVARQSDSWTDIGFQGRDPATDFRGMGLLGLTQLSYFSEQHTDQAREVLRVANGAVYFPFAATGINLTALVLELLQEGRLHAYILAREDQIMLLDDTATSLEGFTNDSKCIEAAARLIHEVYCEIFVELSLVWRASKPKDLMEFPMIFNTLKATLRRRYQPI